jgi:hypothetical protein
MADVDFDLSFDGTLAPTADPLAVRHQLASLFKLDEAGIAQLFTGKPVFIKRAVDVATAAKFERVFAQAGAVLTITPGASGLDATAGPTAPGSPASSDQATPLSSPTSGLALAPQTGFIENPGPVKIPDLDTSYLSLVSTPDWSLEDCQPAVTPAPVGDLSHLSLASIDTSSDTKSNAD